MARPFERLRRGAKNALTILQKGRLGEPYHAPFEVVSHDERVSLRRYGVGQGRPLLLIPPLMVTAQIYDISPELSAVAWLTAQGADVWVADFGTPEELPGGVERTLDDHVLAVSACIDQLRERTGHDVHLVGYSQGGLFCYQTAAYRRGAGLASVVTFGSPIDLHRNAPLALHESIVDQVVGFWRRVIDKPLDDLRALPGTLSSLAFKLVAPGQELKHLVQLLGILPDRDRYLQVEPKRKFLGGEGFIAWPGPALKTFIDDFVVANRLKSGGFVIAGKTVALADIHVPILAFLGDHDDLAQPAAVRAIRDAAPLADVSVVHAPAGHFGLVVGSVAMKRTWPTVLAWTQWRDDRGDRPAVLDEVSGEGHAATLVERTWAWLGKAGVALGEAIDTVKQVPRVIEWLNVGDQRVALAQVLAEHAERDPDGVFLVWRGNAYTYAQTLALLQDGDALAAVGVATDQSWLRGSLVAAIAARLSTRDTVYCAVALSDPFALSAAIGNALVGGARLAIAGQVHDAPEHFWREVRNVGATVVVADDTLLHALIGEAPSEHDRAHPIRVVLTRAIDPSAVEVMAERFGVDVVALG